MNKITFTMSVTSPIFAEMKKPIEDNIGTDFIISDYGSGKIVGMIYSDPEQTRIRVSVQMEFKFPWATKELEYYLSRRNKITCDTQNNITVWTLERKS